MSRKVFLLLAASFALLLSCDSAVATTISPGVFELFNHPDGALTGSHGPYGLRLDGDDPPPGVGPTFSVEADTNPVTLTWNFNGTAVIEGRVLNNTTGEFWDVEFTMTGVFNNNGGFSSTAASGTLTYDDVGVPPASSPIALTGEQNNSGNVFNLFPDGHRLAGDDMTPVGRGWLDQGGDFNDWLVIAVQVEEFIIPEPSSLALCTALVMGQIAIRRRRV